jgi:hypothetical protein
MRCLPALLLPLTALAAGCFGTNNMCLEQVHELEQGGESAHTKAALFLEEAQGTHTATLVWSDGTRTQVILELPAAEAKWVESRRDPDNHTDIGAVCLDRVRLVGQATLRTDDGRMDERFEKLTLDETGEGGLRAWFARRAGALQGAYVRQSQGAKLSSLQFQIDLGAEQFAGSLYENVGNSQTAAIALWGETP